MSSLLDVLCLAFVDLVFLDSILVLGWFRLSMSCFSSALFLSNQSSWTQLTVPKCSMDVSHTISLNFSYLTSTPSGFGLAYCSVRANFRFCCTCHDLSRVTLSLEWIFLFFLIFLLTFWFAVDLIMMWSALQFAPLIVLVSRMSSISHWRAMTKSMRCQCLLLGCIHEYFWAYLCWKKVFVMLFPFVLRFSQPNFHIKPGQVEWSWPTLA